MCHSCYYQSRQLRVIACSLTFNVAVSLVHAFVFSHLDYCSSCSIFAVSQGFGWRSWDGSIGLRHDLFVDLRSLTTYPNICGTSFHSHSASHTGLCPWCGGACLAGRPPICTSSATLSPLLVQAVVHCDPMFTIIWWSHSPALRQCRPVLFLSFVQQPGMDFQ